MKRSVFACIIALSLYGARIEANNLILTNVSLANAVQGKADIQVDLSMDNSWRATWVEAGGGITMSNWDAAWVFLKFRTAGGIWKHGLLAPTGHQVPAGAALTLGTNTDGRILGAFVYRATDGSGTFSVQNLKLKWDYEASNLAGTNAVDISVHGIEMVYVTGGAYYLGSGGTEISHFYTGTNNEPYRVTREDEIPVNTTDSSLRYSNSGDMQGPVPAAYPKGVRPFYCMKYEISQGQYTDFLNLTDPGHARERFPNAYNVGRHTIKLDGNRYVCDAPDRACNYINWLDVMRYLDWAALRPMTELEFEKVCRGPLYPLPNEFAWGNTYSAVQTGHDGTDGSGTETASPANANCNLQGMFGPVRVGIYATANSSRQAAGAAYFGAMEMCGNAHEMVISAGTSDGRAFRGDHGDGNEYTPVPGWVASAVGFRGEGWQGMTEYARTSNRSAASYQGQGRTSNDGGRGVRTVE